VLVCASCGRESEANFPFCPHCGAELTKPAASREQRKTVTVLFCDVTGSTALGESADPESVRALLARYFERMKAILESHGGTVEKFIGDAVMAVFGVPVAHEDDALRACRAAVEMRDALPELGLQARIGLNTGEVVTGTEERLATGDAVNVAARFEQAAQPGEVLIGEETVRLVRDAVEIEPVEPLELKGKAEPVPAHRLVNVHELPERRYESAFVGRTRELEVLQQAWECVLADRRCRLVTLVGEAGVGKSRLVEEFLPSTERVVRGRCLPYGEGITYGPVVEVIKQIDALPGDHAAAAALRSLLGETEQRTSAEEIAWAFRKLLEEQAHEQPVVCLFDDIQWGEETFLDLIEHVALLSSGAPILLLCMARLDLTERRPQWPVALRLEPLPEGEVDQLIPATLVDDLRARIAHAAGGNPLFVTEIVAMARESNGEVVVPPTLQGLLAARLDQLEASERSVLERGAIEGEIFHRGSVQALSDDGQVTPRLASLVRKDLIRPDKPRLPGDDAFRFRHLLIRDAAYEALPKATRAELHERFATWLEERALHFAELDELLGHHLEQAERYKRELGRPDAALAGRAGERLASAGRRALWRGDPRAASQLLARGLILLRPVRLDVELELDLATAQPTQQQAAAVAQAAAEQARAANNRLGEAVARVVATHHRLQSGDEAAVDELEAFALAALPLAEEAGDHAGLVHIWYALGFGVANFRGHFEDCAEAAEKAIHHSRLAGQRRTRMFGLPMALVCGPRPADEALRSLDAVLIDPPHPVEFAFRGVPLAMLGRFDEARSIASEAGERAHELTGNYDLVDWVAAEIATLEGDHAASAARLRRFCELLEQQGRRAELSTFAPMLGRALCTLERHDEAEPLARLGRDLGAEHDAYTQTLWRQVRALVDSQHGLHAQAESGARDAVAIIATTDSLEFQGDALCDLAEVLAAAGRTEEATTTLKQALDRYERKKNLAMVAQVRLRLDELRAGVT